MFEELRVFLGGKGRKMKEYSGPLEKETGCWGESNVTLGGKFLDHLLESA